MYVHAHFWCLVTPGKDRHFRITLIVQQMLPETADNQTTGRPLTTKLYLWVSACCVDVSCAHKR